MEDKRLRDLLRVFSISRALLLVLRGRLGGEDSLTGVTPTTAWLLTLD